MEKRIYYAALITQAITSMFNEDSEAHISLKELEDDDNLTQFIHAMATMAPTAIYNRFTNDNKDNLEFNHIANHLCFQYSNIVDNDETED